MDLTGRNISASIKKRAFVFIGGLMPKVTEEYLETRRQAILEAAISCFTHKGFHQTTMDDICEEAELSPGAVYRYFTSKEEIIQAAVQEGPGLSLISWIDQEAVRFDDFLETMGMFTRLSYQRFEEGESTEAAMKLRLRAWAEALQNPIVREEVLKRWEHHLDLTKQMVSQAQEMGQINPDLDSEAVARVLQATSDGFTLLWTIGPKFDIWKFREVEMALYRGTFWIGEKISAD
jgi:AcrR family transcriptional regulator